ncbi:MAG: hypothetical protein AAF514_09025 [Verrucomicrobiota bacterium]
MTQPDLTRLSSDEKDDLIRTLLARVMKLEAQVEELLEKNEAQTRRIRSLEREIQSLVRRLYGPKSDRPSDEAQTLLDSVVQEAEEGTPDPSPPEKDEDDENGNHGSGGSRNRPSRQGGRKLLPEHLE